MIFNGWVFQVNGLAHDPKIEISKKIGWVFQVNGLGHDPEFEISKKSWMSFPGFDNKG